jgi:hypothetical protein
MSLSPSPLPREEGDLGSLGSQGLRGPALGRPGVGTERLSPIPLPREEGDLGSLRSQGFRGLAWGPLGGGADLLATDGLRWSLGKGAP